MELAVISLVVALIALIVNVSALMRRPRILAEWGEVHDAEGVYVEGLTIIATGRRRKIQVDELGIVLLPKRTWRRRLPEWRHADTPFRYVVATDTELPYTLEDGESIRGFEHTDFTAEAFYKREGVAYAYVKGSGTVYLTRDSNTRRWLQKRRRLGEP